LAKSDGLFAGREYIDALLDNFKLKALWRVRDGSKFKAADRLIFIRGDSRDILSLERSI